MKQFYRVFWVVVFLCMTGRQSLAQWAKSLSGSDGALPTAVVVDGSGNSYVTGNFTGAMTINGTVVLANSSPGIAIETLFLAKLSPQGSLIWIQRATGSNRSLGQAAALDASGNVTVTGNFQGIFTVGSFTLTSTNGTNKEGYVVRYSPQGIPLAAWAVRNPSGDFSCTDVKVDANGNSYVSGTRETVSGGALAKNGFIRKYSIQGQLVWSKEMTGASVTGGHLALTGTGVISTGIFAGTAIFSSQTTLTSTTGQYAASYDSQTGNLQWAYLLGQSSWVTAPAIQADASGFYVANSFAGTLVLGGTTPLVGRSNYYDGFVAKFTVQGAVQWAQSFRCTGTFSNITTCLYLSPGGSQLLVGGSFQGSCTFGTGTQVNSAGDSDLFVASYTTQGVLQGVRRDGGVATEQTLGIVPDLNNSGQILAVGLLRSPQANTTSSTSISGTALAVNATYNDGFVARLVSMPLAMKSGITQAEFTVYPNPCSQHTTLRILGSFNQGAASLALLNVLGQVVYAQAIPARSSTVSVPVADLKPGHYVVRVTTAAGAGFTSISVE